MTNLPAPRRARGPQRFWPGLLGYFLLAVTLHGAEPQLAPNQWAQIQKDPVGARRGSSFRYVPDAGAFFLWGFMNANPDLLQEHPLMEVPEYDMVSFDPDERRWQNHFPTQWEGRWSKKLPLAYIPRTYSGITSGSERSVMRSPTDRPGAAPRPDLNLVFDQVAYHPPSKSLIYFTGGLTAAYSVMERRWTDLSPASSPPPVMAGSLAYDPVNDEIVLFGGGHVAEEGPDGKLVGYTGTWVYGFKSRDWRPLETAVQPSPRMNTRLVTDSKNQVLVLFGGDGQSHYLADTWLYDLRTRRWRPSKAPGGPPPRAGHFTVYDEQTGWVVIGGGYNREDLTDMWAYDAAEDRWRRLAGEVPTGFFIAADIASERRLILLAANTRAPGDTMTCNVLFPVRTTYGYRIDRDSILHPNSTVRAHEPMPKRPPLEAQRGTERNPARERAQAQRLRTLAVNRWVHLEAPGRIAPARTWGSATLDSDRGRILYWGGGHCGYGGSDVDAYDIAGHTWLSGNPAPEYPERAWNLGVRSAGVTFEGKPWMTHGRRIYSYDPVSRKMIMVRPIRLTSGYDPEPLRGFPEERRDRPDAVAKPSSHEKYATYSYDSETRRWELLGGAPAGLDTLVSTPHGVMGINVDWPSRLNDAGYSLPWSSNQPLEDKALYLLDPAQGVWKRLGERQISPQNLYEMTSLAYDSRRDQIILHGGGQNRDELWTFDLKTNRWRKMNPRVLAPEGAAPPASGREAVYIPRDDVFLIYGRAPGARNVPAMWAYKVSENAWRRVDIVPGDGVEPSVAASQNRAMVYDEQRDLVLLVLGTRGDAGGAHVLALRYRHDEAPLVTSAAE